MKLNMVIRKRHIALAALVLALGVAVYLNWNYMKTSGQKLSDSTAVSAGADDREGESTATYGEAYFAEAKLSRTKSRDEAVEAMKTMLAEADLDAATLQTLTTRAEKIAESIETEGKIENLIKAKGFADCMVYLDEDKIDVLVKCDGMTDGEAAQIMDVVLGEVTIPEENISIIEIK